MADLSAIFEDKNFDAVFLGWALELLRKIPNNFGIQQEQKRRAPQMPSALLMPKSTESSTN